MHTQKNHWPSILILIVLALSAAVVFIFSIGLGINSLVDLFSEGGDPAGEMIGAFAFGFEMIVLLVCSWFVLQKTMGRDQAELPIKFPFAGWQVFAVIGMVVLSVVIGGVIAYTEIAWLTWSILPLLTVFVIVPPIWLLFGIGTDGIELGARCYYDCIGTCSIIGNYHHWFDHGCHTTARSFSRDPESWQDH
jgi:hypothetical protein